MFLASSKPCSIKDSSASAVLKLSLISVEYKFTRKDKILKIKNNIENKK